MKYTNDFVDEVYDDFESCRDSLIEMQEEGKSELLKLFECSLGGYSEGDREYHDMLCAGHQFITDCIQFVEALLESSGTDLDAIFIMPYIKSGKDEDMISSDFDSEEE